MPEQSQAVSNNLIEVGPIPLACPCGKPLLIFKQTDGQWAIGAEEACSHLYHIHSEKIGDAAAIGAIVLAFINDHLEWRLCPPSQG